MPVDPGEHVVEAAAQGKIAWKHSVNVGAKADTKTILVPVLETAAAPPPSPTSSATPASAPETHASNHAPAGWVAVGFGTVGVGVGTYFGLRALSQQKDADRECEADRCLSAFGASQNAEAIRSANLATVGFSVGMVGFVVGTYLLLTSGHSARAAATSTSVSAQVSGGVDGIALKGRW